MRKRLPKKAAELGKAWNKRAYLSKSKHQDTSIATFQSPICDIVVGACEAGVHSLSWTGAEDSGNSETRGARDKWGAVTSRQGPSCRHLEDALSWLEAYFRDPYTNQKQPQLCFSQAPAQSCVPIWRKLKEEVGPGATVSYGGLANLCGKPKASRHMGYAMGHNPIGLLVPCHRVVTSSGAIGNYCRGRRNHVKAWLLTHETLAEK